MTNDPPIYGVSIDPSTTATGLAFWKDDEVFLTHCIEDKGGDYLSMSDKVADFLNNYRCYTFEWLSVEPAYHGKNAKVTIMLAGLVAAIEALYNREHGGVIYKAKNVYEIDKACSVPNFLKRPQRKAAVKANAIACGMEEGLVQDIYCAWAVGYWAQGQIKLALWSSHE